MNEVHAFQRTLSKYVWEESDTVRTSYILQGESRLDSGFRFKVCRGVFIPLAWTPDRGVLEERLAPCQGEMTRLWRSHF